LVAVQTSYEDPYKIASLASVGQSPSRLGVGGVGQEVGIRICAEGEQKPLRERLNPLHLVVAAAVAAATVVV